MSVADLAAVTALVAGGVTVGLLAILHVLEPEYDPSWRMISEYSVGRYGWVMRLAFVTMAIGPAAMCVALWPFGGAWTIGLAAVALGALGAAFIDADPIMTRRAEATRLGRAHTVLGGVLLAGFPPAASIAGVGVASELGWTLRSPPLFRSPAWCGSSSPLRPRTGRAARLRFESDGRTDSALSSIWGGWWSPLSAFCPSRDSRAPSRRPSLHRALSRPTPLLVPQRALRSRTGAQSS